MAFFSQIRYLLSLNMSRMVISWGTLEGAVGWTIHILMTRMLSLKQVWRHSSWWSSLGMWLKEWDICLPKMLVLISSAETFIIRYFWTLRVLCWRSDILRTRMLRLKQVWRHSSWWSSFGMWLKEWDICLPKMLVLISSAETFIIRYSEWCMYYAEQMILIAMNCGTSEISSMRFQRIRIRVVD